ncbi:MAG: hypothetical protein WCH39_08805 [Schlesneria sp.]
MRYAWDFFRDILNFSGFANSDDAGSLGYVVDAASIERVWIRRYEGSGPYNGPVPCHLSTSAEYTPHRQTRRINTNQ